MAVNRRLLKERLNLDPGLIGKTKPHEKNHLKLFWKNSQGELNCRMHGIGGNRAFLPVERNSNFVKFRNFEVAK